MALRRMEERALQAEKRVSTEDVAPARPPRPKCSVCFKHCQASVNPWQRTKNDLTVAEPSDDSDEDEEAEDENGITEIPTCNSTGYSLRAANIPFVGHVWHTTSTAASTLSLTHRAACQVKPGEQPVEISDMTARLVLGEANMDEWNHARFLSTLNLIYCPHKGCDETFDADDVAPAPAASRSYGCPRCRGSLCKVLQTLPGTERAPEDVAFATLAAQEKWRRCPKCSAMVELKFGCNHITCICNHHFCYTCGADFEHTNGKYQCKGGAACKVWEEQNLLNRK
ncbi:hypothetical protein B0H14DRAFT_3780480 [Mycena olivaceomarginata]|nr:hypothetical protein B0H14DRAFT_3780480 [Mycena olivaceomarginata]